VNRMNDQQHSLYRYYYYYGSSPRAEGLGGKGLSARVRHTA